MMFDTLIIGQVCLDTNTDYDGSVTRSPGGAVLFSGHAAAAMGNRVAVLPKCACDTVDLAAAFGSRPNITVFPLCSRESTLMENTYFAADRERRLCRCAAMIDPYRPDELPEFDAKLRHLAGLVRGDIGNDMIKACAKRGDTALDVQCMLRRRNGDGSMDFHDWAEKRELVPLLRFLKTDAAEAEILTGLAGPRGRAEAARLMCGWGAREVMITHNTEVLVCDGTHTYVQPLKPRNLSGRTGRGDTCFACYITERLREDIPTSLLRAAALVSLKMETPGPFAGTRADVENYIARFYRTGVSRQKPD